jgi:hypothetical protein
MQRPEGVLLDNNIMKYLMKKKKNVKYNGLAQRYLVHRHQCIENLINQI